MRRLQTITTEQAMNRKTIDFVARAKDTTIKKDGEYKIVEVPIQSTNRDRDGDIITDKGQAVILEQLKSGEVPAFPNHGIGDFMAFYDFRDIMGQWTDGTVRDDGVTMGTLRLRNGSDAAEHLLDLIEQDMPVGFSIGFIIREAEEEEEGGLLITDLDLIEVSPVGIPSNASAVAGSGFTRGERVAMAAKGIVDKGEGTQALVKALEKALKDDSEEETEQEPEEDKSHSMTTDEEQEKTPELEESEKQTPDSSESEQEEESKMDDSKQEDDEEEKQTPEENAEAIAALAEQVAELSARVSALEESGDDEESDSAEEDEDNDERSADTLSDDEKSHPERQPKKIKATEGDGEESEKDPAVIDAPATGFSTRY